MGKGKKKAKGKRRGGKKTRNDKDDGDSPDEGDPTLQITLESHHVERARLAASNRTEDPLKNWTRLQNEECPICMLPLPYEISDFNYCVTCGKTVCMGCVISTGIMHRRDGGDGQMAYEKAFTCPYCRSSTTAASYDDKSALEQEMKRANAGNSESMGRIGQYYFKGQIGVQQDKAEGLKWYHRAAEAGSGLAAYIIGNCYDDGDGVEQDIDKALEYLQKSAELGYIPAFFLIGYLLEKRGEIEEGLLNYRKAVICGMSMSDDSLFDILRNGFKEGVITKEEYAFTLREHQNARNETESEARQMWRTIFARTQNQRGTR